ncbi:malate dehydrogenase [Stagonosporopsis vannaccii]|nr:malate dehydrogenase [Stagonosporopsis vannaccii]
MIFTTTLSLVLALAPITLLAAPAQAIDSIAHIVTRDGISPRMVEQTDSSIAQCDLSAATLPTDAPGLPAIGSGLKLAHIAIGRGVQNYTCSASSASETPKAIGAVAALFNATCDSVRAPAVLASVTKIALDYAIPSSELADARLSGHHEFTENGIPFFKLQTARVDFGSVHVNATAKVPAPKDASQGPNGLGSVPWLKLVQLQGDYKEVYRVNTAGGVAPKTCEGVTGVFSVEYAAEYWFYA